MKICWNIKAEIAYLCHILQLYLSYGKKKTYIQGMAPCNPSLVIPGILNACCRYVVIPVLERLRGQLAGRSMDTSERNPLSCCRKHLERLFRFQAGS